jgi:ComF family protein
MISEIRASLNELSNPGRRKLDSIGRRLHARGVAGLSRLLPQRCALCGAASGAAVLCADCLAALPALPAACPRCAQPSAAGAECGACLRVPPRVGATIAARAYAFPMDRLVQALKYEHRLEIALALGEALAEAVVRAGPCVLRAEAIVPLPLSATRQRERGFNQAIEIGRVVARRTGVPLSGVLSRARGGPPQASLPWRERVRNVRGAFVCAERLDGRHVAILDDVMTTGATIDAAAEALLAAGAGRVDAWVVARTPR